MLRQSKFTQQAIAAVSRLAEVYPDAAAWLSAADIADARKLRRPAAAKVLSVLAQEQLVRGFPGPGGGYRLGRHPKKISLWDVVHLFERERALPCPYGPGWCGAGAPCPLHDSLAALHQVVESYLRKTTFDVFTRRLPAPCAAHDGRSAKEADDGTRREPRIKGFTNSEIMFMISAIEEGAALERDGTDDIRSGN